MDDGLDPLIRKIPDGGTRRTFGTAHWDGSRWRAVVGNKPMDVWWLDPIQLQQGCKIVIDITKDEYGQASALVLGGYSKQPRPGSGTVMDVTTAGVATEIIFTGDDGVSYSTDRFIGSYGIGDQVYVAWAADKPSIIGKIPAIIPPPPVQPPAPTVEAQATGYEVLTVTASDTFGVGGWGRWATSRPTATDKGEDVYTGTWGGYTLTGSWFYGWPPAVLAGKAITKTQFRVPGRLPGAGNYNDPITIYLYAHRSISRPDGDVNRVAGPYAITVLPGAGPKWEVIPNELGSIVAAGGGLSIAGGNYIGFQSRLDDPESGKLILDWAQQ